MQNIWKYCGIPIKWMNTWKIIECWENCFGRRPWNNRLPLQTPSVHDCLPAVLYEVWSLHTVPLSPPFSCLPTISFDYCYLHTVMSRSSRNEFNASHASWLSADCFFWRLTNPHCLPLPPTCLIYCPFLLKFDLSILSPFFPPGPRSGL